MKPERTPLEPADPCVQRRARDKSMWGFRMGVLGFPPCRRTCRGSPGFDGPLRVPRGKKALSGFARQKRLCRVALLCTDHPRHGHLGHLLGGDALFGCKMSFGGLNDASFTRAQPAPNRSEAHNNGAKRASQQLACLAPDRSCWNLAEAKPSRPRRGRAHSSVPLHCNRLRL